MSAGDAWKHVYRLLLWIDRTTGLAHCYESDKSQPGRHWYGRSLAFHAWLAEQFRTDARGLAGSLDWLFRHAVEEFARAVSAQKANRTKAAEAQRAPYKDRDMPEPGENPELIEIIRDALKGYLKSEPPTAEWRLLTEEIAASFTQENKRRNLVGEAFEDLLAELVRRVPARAKLSASTRKQIEDIPGFSPPTAKDKKKKVDVVVLREQQPTRILATAKWSIRADREEQFASDYDSYARLENAGELFEYHLITNEFDPARLAAACERLTSGHLLFHKVVHVNPAGLFAAYGKNPENAAARVIKHMEAARLVSLEAWLSSLAS